MAAAIKIAVSKLTPSDHTECVQILIAAQIPIDIVSRVIFMPHQSRLQERRRDSVTASLIERARAILHCSNETDARQYLAMKNIPFPLIQRALYDAFHRKD